MALPEDTDHARESAAMVKEALANCGLALEQGGLEALTTVENFLDVWHLPANAARRPQFLSALADAETVDRIVSLAEGEAGPVGRVALGLLNRMAQDSAAGPLLLPRLDRVLQLAQGAAAGAQRLMWLETSSNLLEHHRGTVPADFAAFLSACLAASAIASQGAAEEAAMCSELSGLVAARILGRGGASVALQVLRAVAASRDWRCEQALESHAKLLLDERAKKTEMPAMEVAAAALAFRDGAQKKWRQCGLWVAAHFPEEPHCGACGVAGKLLQCGACHAANYCSTKCQKDDWPKHKAVCRKKTTTPL